MKNGRVRATALFSFFVLALIGSRTDGQVNADATPYRRWLLCDIGWLIGEHYRTASDFAVRLAYRSQVVPSTKIVLMIKRDKSNRSAGRVVATAETDADGVAHFFAIPPGRYEAHPDGELLVSYEEVEVEANRTAKEGESLQIEWPVWSTVIQSVQGTMTVWDYSEANGEAGRSPLRNVQLELLDLRSAKLLGLTFTDELGRYAFPSIPDGLYVLRVDANPANVHEYERAVEVSAMAKRQNMPGLQVDKVCGNGLEEVVENKKAGQMRFSESALPSTSNE
ncbi:MAG TPA: hypothetical protein VJP02_20385 [Candidatus Sulfotelmatobacter sp.]|nr:hypothetical protein [Candidatus Sulfotelmatobacter sp.]